MPKLDLDAIPQTNATGYPAPFDAPVSGRRYRRLALNRLKGRTLATPAVTGNRLLIRTDRELVCVGRE